jgi:hypothetical protein
MENEYDLESTHSRIELVSSEDEVRQCFKAIEVLAKEGIANPETRNAGISERILGARIGAYRDNPIYIVAYLEDFQLARRLRFKHGNKIQKRIVLTEYGRSFAEYMKYIPPSIERVQSRSFFHRFWALILIICTLLGGISAAIYLLKGC